MAEVQTNTQTGELSQRFIEFIMMQAQNAALFLGQIPNPQTGQGEVNLELAKMFIDQLGMIQEKTRGNLTNEESAVLKNTLANLQMAFVEVSQQVKGGGATASTPTPAPESETASPAQPSSAAEKSELSASSPAPETESRKKFTKSYGA
ncbi:MAG: hypothetical protein DLM73_05485 [Chthoniobacterales bacterium]|nr:MAG: hypothetical protein DLM73_05485 [Chthoniobacterales bacterium]